MTAALNILLVEDNADTATVLSLLLRRYGYAVKIVGGVQAAKKLAAVEAFDLLLCDLGLPDGSGADLMRELKTLYDMKGIALSGHAREEDIQRSKQAGFSEHLVKPVDFDQLDQSIRRVLHNEDSQG